METISFREASQTQLFNADGSFGIELVVDPSEQRDALYSTLALDRSLDITDAPIDIRRLTDEFSVIVMRGADYDVTDFSAWVHLKPSFRKSFVGWHIHANPVTALMAPGPASPFTHFGEVMAVLEFILNSKWDIPKEVLDRYLGKIQAYFDEYSQIGKTPNTKNLMRSKVSQGLKAIMDPRFAETFEGVFERFHAAYPESSVLVPWEPGMALFGSSHSAFHGSPDCEATGVLIQRAA